MGANVALSLLYSMPIGKSLSLRTVARAPLAPEPRARRLALGVLSLGTLASGVLPQPWVAIARRAAVLWASGGN
jgi:hypothetical protein